MRPLRPLWRPTGRRAATASAGAVSTALFALAGCSSSAQTTGGADGLGVEAPLLGVCRVLTAADLRPSTNDTPTVSCGSPHTSVTIDVGIIPSWMITNTNLQRGTVGNEALKRCTEAWRRTVGGDASTQHTTVLNLAYFLPDGDQLSNGARWYRCDLVIGGKAGMPLRDLPDDVTGLLDGGEPESLRACRTAPDFERGRQVSCDEDHVLRAIGTAPLPDQVSYPGEAVLRRAGSTGCRSVVGRWRDGSIGAGIASQWPDQVGWSVLRDRLATCWAVTTS